MTYHIKDGGVVTNNTRRLTSDLISLDVPANKIDGVIHRVYENVDIKVDGKLSERSIWRITHEGGVASKLQIMNTICKLGSM